MRIVRFFEMLLKFSDLINPDNCIAKIISKSIRLQPVFIKKKFEVNIEQIFF